MGEIAPIGSQMGKLHRSLRDHSRLVVRVATAVACLGATSAGLLAAQAPVATAQSQPPSVEYISPPAVEDTWGGSDVISIFGSNFSGPGFQATQVEVGSTPLTPETSPTNPPPPGQFRVVAPTEIEATLPTAALAGSPSLLPVLVTTPEGTSAGPTSSPPDPAAELAVLSDTAAPLVAQGNPPPPSALQSSSTDSLQATLSLPPSFANQTVVVILPWVGAADGSNSYPACAIQGPSGWQIGYSFQPTPGWLSAYAYSNSWNGQEPTFVLSYTGCGVASPPPGSLANLAGAEALEFPTTVDAASQVVPESSGSPTVSFATPVLQASSPADLVLSCVNTSWNGQGNQGPYWLGGFEEAANSFAESPASPGGTTWASSSCEENFASQPGIVGGYPAGAYTANTAAFSASSFSIAITGSLLVPSTGFQVSAISPSSGPLGGQTTVTIQGSGFSAGTVSAVYFGSLPATSFSVVSSNEIQATAPAWPFAGIDGRAEVVVEGSGGVSLPTPAAEYAYVPPWIPTQWASVSCTSPTYCVAAGNSDFGPALATSTNGGSRWTLVAPTAQDLVGQVTYGQVSCEGATSVDCIAVSDPGFPTPTVTYSTNGGQTWMDANLPPPPAGALAHGIGYIEAADCFGQTCIIGGNYNGSSEQVPFIYWSNDAGATWQESTLPPGLPGGLPWGGDNSVYAISCWSTTDCIAAGSYFKDHPAEEAWAIETTDGGQLWQLIAASIPGIGEISSLSCLSVNQCLGAAYTPGAQEALAVYATNSGTSWEQVAMPSGVGGFMSISCSGPSLCEAGGYTSSSTPALAESTDGGQSWIGLQEPPLAGGGFWSGLSCVQGSSFCLAVGRTASHVPLTAATNNASTWQLESLGNLMPFAYSSSLGNSVTIYGANLGPSPQVFQEVSVPDLASPPPGAPGSANDPLIPEGEVAIDSVNPPPITGETYSADLPSRLGGFFGEEGPPPISAGAVAAWINTSAQTSAGMNILTWNMAGPNRASLVLDMGTAGIDRAGYGSIGCYVNADDVAIGVYTQNQYNDGTWHFVVCNWLGGNLPSDFQVYVDGQQVPTDPIDIGTFTPPIYSPDGYRIGTGFAGFLADVAVWDDTGLTAAQVAQFYAAASQPAGTYASLMEASASHFWQFNSPFNQASASSISATSSSSIEASLSSDPSKGGAVEVEVAQQWLPAGYFWYPPQLSAVSPAFGSSSGGTVVTLSGSALTGTGSVYFGSAPAEWFSVLSPNEVMAIAPPGNAGSSVPVTIYSPAGQSTSQTQFTYEAPPTSPPPPASPVSIQPVPSAPATTTTTTTTVPPSTAPATPAKTSQPVPHTRAASLAIPSAALSGANGALVKVATGGIYELVGGKAVPLANPAELASLRRFDRALVVAGAVSANEVVAPVRPGTVVALANGSGTYLSANGHLYLASRVSCPSSGASRVWAHNGACAELAQAGYLPSQVVWVPYLPAMPTATGPLPNAAHTRANGALVETPRGAVYELVGGRALPVRTRGILLSLLHAQPRRVVAGEITSAMLNHPIASGTLVAKLGSPGIWVYFGSKPWGFDSPAELARLGYSPSEVIETP
jgi:hypothetical protein